MPTEQFYYHIDDLAKTDEDGDFEQLTPGQAAAVSSLNEYVLQKISQGETSFLIKFLKAPLTSGVVGELVSESINATVNWIEGDTYEINVGDFAGNVGSGVLALKLLEKAAEFFGVQVGILGSVFAAGASTIAYSLLAELRNDLLD